MALSTATAPRTAPIGRLWLAVLAGYLALGATLQTLPALVGQRFHGGPLATGLAVGIAFAATAAVRPFAGRAGDSGLSRRTCVLGGVLTAVGGLGQYLAPDLAVLLLARVVQGAGEAALFSAALPWVLASTAGHGRGRVAGWFGLSMWSGLAAGPALAAIVDQQWGERTVWFGVIGAGFLAAVLVATTRVGIARTAPAGRVTLLPRGAGLPGLALGLAAFGYGTISSLLVLFLRNAQLGGDGIALAVFAVAFLITRAVGSPLVDRRGPVPVALVLAVVETVGLVLIATAHNQLTGLLGTALTGVGLGVIYPATAALTLRRTGPSKSSPGTEIGAMTSCWDLGIMLAGPICGLLAAGPGYRPAFLAAALTAVLAGAVIVTARRARQ